MRSKPVRQLPLMPSSIYGVMHAKNAAGSPLAFTEHAFALSKHTEKSTRMALSSHVFFSARGRRTISSADRMNFDSRRRRLWNGACVQAADGEEAH